MDYARHTYVFMGAISISILALCSCSGRPKVLDEEVFKILENADSAIFYSLEPKARIRDIDDKNLLHNFKILGSVKLDEADTRTVVKEFVSAAADPAKITSKCFWPRHVPRVNHDGHVLDYLLCFECPHLWVYRDGKLALQTGASGSPDVLNAMVTKAGMPLAKPPSLGPEAEE